MDFAHLHVASAYSLRHGATMPADLVARAAEHGQSMLALTDRDGVYGAVRFVQACATAGIAPILGVDLALDLAVANLGWTDIKLTHPVYVGDTIYAESVCIDKRESSSRPEMGIITMKTRGLNQDGDEVVSWLRTVMIPKRTSGIGQDYFPQAKSGPLAMPEA